MKRWKVGLLTSLLVVCMAVLLAGCQQQTYKPQSKSQTVPATALSKSGVLRVGVNASSAPLAGQTSASSRIVGIDVDVAAYLADQLGVKVEVVDVGSDPVSALKNGNVDIVLGVDASSDSDTDYWRSASYLQTGVALFGTKSESAIPTVDSKPKIAAQASSKSSWRVTNIFGDSSLVSQSDLKSAFGALESGSARYVAADAVIGTYVAYSNGYADKIVALLQEPSGYCAAVAQNNTELQTAITSAMSTLVDGGAMDVIEGKWLGTTMNLKDIPVLKSSGSDSGSTSTSSSASSSSSASQDASASASAQQQPAA